MSKKKRPSGSRTVETLLEIIADGEIDTSREIEAVQLLVEYECAPDTVHTAREFLEEIFQDGEAHIDNRLEALRISRRLEAKKIMPKVVHASRTVEGLSRTEAWRNYEIWTLKREIIKATHEIPPQGYADVLLGDDYVPPFVFDGTDWPPTTIQRNGLIFNVVYGGKAGSGD
jgi:hypothetical protein